MVTHTFQKSGVGGWGDGMGVSRHAAVGFQAARHAWHRVRSFRFWSMVTPEGEFPTECCRQGDRTTAQRREKLGGLGLQVLGFIADPRGW